MAVLSKKLLEILLCFSLALIFLILSVKFTLNFRPLYYFDIDYLQIQNVSGLSKDKIKQNYNYLIDYINEDDNIEFHLPSLPYSENGKTHFVEVKNIFTFLNRLLIICIIINLIGLALKFNILLIIKKVSTALLILPIIILLAFLINFNASFVVFHKIFFRNNYWIFDPKYDPVINILPQDFFFHCALSITILVILTGILLKIFYLLLIKRRIKSF